MNEEKKTERDELSEEELEEEHAEPLPDREAMSVITDPSGLKMPPVFEGDSSGESA